MGDFETQHEGYVLKIVARDLHELLAALEAQIPRIKRQIKLSKGIEAHEAIRRIRDMGFDRVMGPSVGVVGGVEMVRVCCEGEFNGARVTAIEDAEDMPALLRRLEARFGARANLRVVK